jgi:phage FluMu protein Com
MIIYGSKATQVATENINDKCPNCGTQNSIQMTVFQKYAHVFWIPFFPIGKTAATQCSHCKQVLQKKEFTGNLNNDYETLKSNSKTPIWTFSGLALLTALIIWGTISGKQNDEKNAKLILTPQKGDIYEIKKDYKQYTLYKVENIAGDTVFVFVNQYETNKITGLSGLKNKGDEAFIQEPLPILKKELKVMLDKGEIIDIDRK